MTRPNKTTPDGFQEAIAQWHLDVRTEVKRASSLPTAMFDACDPMLEARLAETAETMLACLQEPGTEVLAPTGRPAEKRIELVAPAELQRLPSLLAGMVDRAVELDHGLDAEFLGVLTDTCATADGDGPAMQTALRLLEREFAVDHATDLQTLTQQLWQRVLDGQGTVDDAALAAVCRRIAASVSRAVETLPEPPEPTP